LGSASMALQSDIVERIRRDFGEDAETAIEMLGSSGHDGRLARCIVVASGGSLDRLREYIEVAKRDYRDAIVAGEYDAAGRRVRDLSVSFLLDSPEKFWASGIAGMMAARGYALCSVTSRDSAVPPFQSTWDSLEGNARFVGPAGVIELEKRNRQWSIHGDPGELETYNMNRAFEDESAFRDAVSGYILNRRQPRG
jgi:hypothetical protein